MLLISSDQHMRASHFSSCASSVLSWTKGVKIAASSPKLNLKVLQVVWIILCCFKHYKSDCLVLLSRDKTESDMGSDLQ